MGTANTIAVGTGSLKEEDARQVTQGWRSATEAGRPHTRAARATPHVLSSMGIRVVTVPKGASE